MFTSDCIAHKKTAQIEITTVDGRLPALRIVNGDNDTRFTLSIEQLELLLDAGEWWLFKMHESQKEEKTVEVDSRNTDKFHGDSLIYL